MFKLYETQWQLLSEDSRYDPVTVAACKHLRDTEIVLKGGQMGLDIAKDVIIPEAEKALSNIKDLFVKFTDAAQKSLKFSVSRGALMLAIQAKEALVEVEGAITTALDDLEDEITYQTKAAHEKPEASQEPAKADTAEES